MPAVVIARRNSEVCTTSGVSPASASCCPPRSASARPASLRGTSTQPVKRFSAFQTLSPWRSRTRVVTTGSALVAGGAAVGLVRLGRRARGAARTLAGRPARTLAGLGGGAVEPLVVVAGGNGQEGRGARVDRGG